MVWRGNGYDVQILVLQHLAQVGKALHLVLVHAALKHTAVHVAQRVQPHTLLGLLHVANKPDVAAAASTETDGARIKRIVGALDARPAGGCHAHRCARIKRGLEERSAALSCDGCFVLFAHDINWVELLLGGKGLPLFLNLLWVGWPGVPHESVAKSDALALLERHVAGVRVL